MECVTETNIFAFGIPLIKVIASIGKHSDRIIECGNCFGLHLNCDIGAHCEQKYTHCISHINVFLCTKKL